MHSLDLMAVASAEGDFIKVNPEFERGLGWKIEDLKNNSYFNCVHPEDIAGTRLEFQRISDGLPTLPFEKRYRCKGGEYKWLSWRASILKDRRCYLFARDVTEPKMAAQRLRKAAEMQSALADLGARALQNVDVKTVFKICLELCAKVLGFEYSGLAVDRSK